MKSKLGLGILGVTLLMSANSAFAATQKAEKVLVALEGGGAVLLCARTGAILQRFATGPNAFGTLFSQDGKRAFITDKDNGTLLEVDPSNGKVLSSLTVGTQPQQPAMTSQGKIYIPLSGGEGVAIVEATRELKVQGKISTGAGTKPHIVALSPDERTLWATVQGRDPRVVAISLSSDGEKIAQEFRYDIFPRVISAGDGYALFTGHHSTGLHLADLSAAKTTTPYMDVNGNASEAAKQIEGVSVIGGSDVVGITHEGRKALVTLQGKGRMEKSCDISPLADKPYWVSLDGLGEVAFVSIPNKEVVEAYDVKACRKQALWSRNVGGKAKRMSLSEAH